MIPASLFEQIGGVKTLILAALALLIALYLWHLSRQEKKETAAPLPSPEELAALPDKELVDTVVRDLLAEEGPEGRTPLSSRVVSYYRRIPLWSNGQVNVFSVWLMLHELAAVPFDGLKGESAAFLPLAAEGFAQIGAPGCEAAVRELQDDAFEAAVEAERPIALCAAYIRDNMDMFVKGEKANGTDQDQIG